MVMELLQGLPHRTVAVTDANALSSLDQWKFSFLFFKREEQEKDLKCPVQTPGNGVNLASLSVRLESKAAGTKRGLAEECLSQE